VKYYILHTATDSIVDIAAYKLQLIKTITTYIFAKCLESFGMCCWRRMEKIS
jgi:hypothetical protein